MTQIATLLCLGCIAYLFWLDRGRTTGVSNAVWIPFFWMMFAGSRFASQWLSLGTPQAMGIEDYSEGSPLDRNVFLALIIAGTWILARRRLDWLSVIRQNYWLLLFFAFAFVSVTWSDDPLVSFKRWIKGAGNVVMALVLVTEKQPFEALGVVLRRLAFVLLPLSILFIRYYPEIGRSYHMGAPMFTGVTLQKNSLGQLCMLLSIYFAWLILLRGTIRDTESYRLPRITLILVVLMLLWLLRMANSATAQAVTLASVLLFLTARLSFFSSRPNRLVTFAVVSGATYLVLDQIFDLQSLFIRMLGREPDLTDRKPLWDIVLSLVPNQWVGAGYEIFWSGDRLRQIWAFQGRAAGGVVQAHSGYIDLYVNLGIIGVVLLGASSVSAATKARRMLSSEYAHAVLCLALILMALAYNYTEAAFKPVNNVFVALLFGCLAAQSRNNAANQVERGRSTQPVVRSFGNVRQAGSEPPGTRNRFHKGNVGTADDRLSRP